MQVSRDGFTPTLPGNLDSGTRRVHGDQPRPNISSLSGEKSLPPLKAGSNQVVIQTHNLFNAV